MTQKKWWTPSLVILLLGFGVVILGQWRVARHLRGRLQSEESAHARLLNEHQTLKQRSSALAQTQQGDRDLIRQLWKLAQDDHLDLPPQSQVTHERQYDLTTVKDALSANGGDLEAVVQQILTPEHLEAILAQHPDEPEYWVAAASMCGDSKQALQYLEEAAERSPDSAIVQSALIETRLGQQLSDEDTLSAIADLRRLDSNNALPDHYEAYCRFQQGDTEGALQALATASDKDRLVDHRLELLMGRYECLLENGCSDGAAIGLSAFTLPFDHLPMLREVSEKGLQQAQASFSSGQQEQALQIAEYLVRLGRNLSSSGRFVVYDRVGIELQQSALETQRAFYQARGDTFQVQETDYQLGAIQQRAADIAEMAGAFGEVLSGMDERAIIEYIDATIMHGEFSTLQTLTGTP